MMGADVKITELGRAFTFGPIAKIKTPLQSEGLCSWLPDSDIALGTKTVYKNGLYLPADDGKYGYSSVTVNVSKEAQSIAGKDANGKYKVVTKSGSNIVETSAPSEIRVTTTPTKTQYDDGQALVFDGIVVTAYDSDGSIWTSAEYPNGIIPLSELSFGGTRAHYDATSEMRHTLHTSFLETNWRQPIITWARWNGEKETDVYSWTPNAYTEMMVQSANYRGIKFTCVSKTDEGGYTYAHTYKPTWHTESEFHATNQHKTIYGDDVYYTGEDWWLYNSRFTDIFVEIETKPDPDNNSIWTVLYGTSVKASYQEVPVMWKRPADHAVLQAKFDIEVKAA